MMPRDHLPPLQASAPFGDARPDGMRLPLRAFAMPLFGAVCLGLVFGLVAGGMATAQRLCAVAEARR